MRVVSWAPPGKARPPHACMGRQVHCETASAVLPSLWLSAGVSGARQRRLADTPLFAMCMAAAEMVVGMSSVMFMDEISNGLDSSVTLQIVKALGQFAAGAQVRDRPGRSRQGMGA